MKASLAPYQKKVHCHYLCIKDFVLSDSIQPMPHLVLNILNEKPTLYLSAHHSKILKHIFNNKKLHFC